MVGKRKSGEKAKAPQAPKTKASPRCGQILRKRRGKTSALDDVMKEVEMLTKLRHPNVVVLYEVIHDPAQDYLYMGKLPSISKDHSA